MREHHNSETLYAPDYLSSKLQKYACPKPNMTMRSAMDTLKPSFNLNKFGYRAFSVAGPRIWNELPRGDPTQSECHLLQAGTEDPSLP